MASTGNVLNLSCHKSVDALSIDYLNNTFTASVRSKGVICSISKEHIQCDWETQKDLSLSKVKELIGSSTITIEKLQPRKFSLKIALFKNFTKEKLIELSEYKKEARLEWCLQKEIESIEKEFGNSLSGYEICTQFEYRALKTSFDDMLKKLLSTNKRGLVVDQKDSLESSFFVLNYLKKYQSGYFPFFAKWLAHKQNEPLSIDYVLKSLDVKEDTSFLKSIPTLWFIQIEIPTKNEDIIMPTFCKTDFYDWPLAKLVIFIKADFRAGGAQRCFAPSGHGVLLMKIKPNS